MKLLKKLASISNDRKILVLIFSYFVGSAVFGLLNEFLFIDNSPSPLTLIFYLCILLPIFIFAIPAILKTISLRDLLFFLLLLFIFAIAYMFFPQNRSYMVENVPGIIISCIPYYFIFRMLPLFSKESKKILWLASLLSILFLCSKSIIIYIKESGPIEMELSYGFLFYSLFNCYFAFESKKIYEISIASVAIIISMLSMFILGSRGPILFVTLYILFLLLNVKIKKTISKTLFLIFLFIFILITVIFYKEFYSWFSKIADIIGFEGRLFEIDSITELFSLRGRDELSETVYKAMPYSLAYGYGLFGDWFITSGSRYNYGVYVHNIFLGFISNFGSLSGLIFFILFVYLCLKMLVFYKKYSYAQSILQILIICGFLKLFISGTFITEKYFWSILGFYIGYLDIRDKTSSKVYIHNILNIELFQIQI